MTRYLLLVLLTGCGGAFTMEIPDGDPHHDSGLTGDTQGSDHNAHSETGQDSSDSRLEAGRETGPGGPETGPEAGDSGPKDTATACDASRLWEQCRGPSCIYGIYYPAQECSCDYTCACLEALPVSELPSGCPGLATCSFDSATGYLVATCS